MLIRLDKYLVEKGYFESRNRALEAIKAGRVSIDGKVAKPSSKVSQESCIEITPAKFYVSRAARKLEGFLDAYPIAVEGKRALDIGSSTGGFAQILLERGVASLACVDVGKEQLHSQIRQDPRVSIYEQTDIRDFTDDRGFSLITCDVSFISILHIIEAIDRLAQCGAQVVILYKPQFEVGKKAKRDAKGVVVDHAAIETAKERFECKTQSLGWRLLHAMPSPLAGKEGNIEYLYLFEKQSKTR